MCCTASLAAISNRSQKSSLADTGAYHRATEDTASSLSHILHFWTGAGAGGSMVLAQKVEFKNYEPFLKTYLSEFLMAQISLSKYPLLTLLPMAFAINLDPWGGLL